VQCSVDRLCLMFCTSCAIANHRNVLVVYCNRRRCYRAPCRRHVLSLKEQMHLAYMPRGATQTAVNFLLCVSTFPVYMSGSSKHSGKSTILKGGLIGCLGAKPQWVPLVEVGGESSRKTWSGWSPQTVKYFAAVLQWHSDASRSRGSAARSEP